MIESALTHLACTACGLEHPADRLQNVCTRCGKPLGAQYDLARAARTLTREGISARERSLWRFAEVLPVLAEAHRLSLGEGGTPLLRSARLAALAGMDTLFIK